MSSSKFTPRTQQSQARGIEVVSNDDLAGGILETGMTFYIGDRGELDDGLIVLNDDHGIPTFYCFNENAQLDLSFIKRNWADHRAPSLRHSPSIHGCSARFSLGLRD